MSLLCTCTQARAEGGAWKDMYCMCVCTCGGGRVSQYMKAHDSINSKAKPHNHSLKGIDFKLVEKFLLCMDTI